MDTDGKRKDEEERKVTFTRRGGKEAKTNDEE
jgi:hypothetical protein